MDQKLLPILKTFMIAITAIIFVFTIFAIGFWYGAKTQVIKGTYQDGWQDGWQAAREKLEQSGLLPPEPEEIFVLSGTVTKISENRISFKANQVVANPLAEPAPEERTILITPETKIFKLTEKSPEELAAEEEAFRKASEKLEPGTPLPTAPSFYREEEIGVTELAPGNSITVTADQNIKFATEFEAKEIRVVPAITAPLPLP